MTDDELINNALQVLNTMFHNYTNKLLTVNNIENYARSNWNQDKYAQQAYPFIKAEGDLNFECSAIQESVWNRVFFAGDHCMCQMIGTTTGAYISG